ncbi:terminase small subunit [uncultured Psychrobacillus sp.]|uniref:terminase small subunit n=1 Tax=uncultured Psychrobacillus sp. TaxID=1551585 RepID=UPI0026053DC3|nr:terminase small subunit [uncultured Psychrobacillus sp.]
MSKDAVEKGMHTKSKRVHTKKESKESVVESDELTEKQRLFCIYYIKYFNATKAYQKAYKCAYTTAMTNGHGLLRNTKISNEIDRMKSEQANELKLDARDIIQKYIDIAFADITDFVSFSSETLVAKGELGRNMKDDEGNNITYNVNHVDFKNSEDVDGTIISEVKKGKDGVSVKLVDKMKALEMLSKYTDLLNDNQLKQLRIEKAKAEINKHEKGDGSTGQESEIAKMLRKMAGDEYWLNLHRSNKKL